MMNNTLNNLNQADIQRLLASSHTQDNNDLKNNEQALAKEKPWREASVLIPFMRIDEAWHILFIRRATLEGDKHSGQVAFPGGKKEESDANDEMTALREAHEEVGIQPNDVSLLGQLGYHYSGVSQFRITPIVGMIEWPYSLVLQQEEVAHTFTMPLSWLADQNNYEERSRRIGQADFPVIYYQPYEGEVLWGATARMVLSLVEHLSA